MLLGRWVLWCGVVVVMVMSFSGCSGHLYTVENAKKLECCKDQGDFYEGVRIYPPAAFYEVTWLTGVVNDKGELTHTASGKDPKKCWPQAKRELVVRPDYSKTMQLVYKPGFLETNKFGVELKDGVLVKVNTESAPDKGETLKNLTGAAAEAAKMAALPFVEGERGPKICTHLPVLKFVMTAQEACPNGVCDFKKYYPLDPP